MLNKYKMIKKESVRVISFNRDCFRLNKFDFLKPVNENIHNSV